MKKYFIYIVTGFTCLSLLFIPLYKRSIHIKLPVMSNSKITVAASFYPIYFFASQIGGDKAHVTSITPAGAEPHDYEPTAQDISHIEKNNMLVLNGGALESWGDK